MQGSTCGSILRTRGEEADIAYTGKDFAVRHAAATRADSIGFKGVILEKDGGTTASDGHVLVNLTRRDAEPREKAGLVDPNGIKDAAARAKVMPSFEPQVSKPIEFEWRHLVPTGPPARTIKVTAELLAKVAKVAIDAFGKTVPLEIEFRGSMGHVVVRAQDEERTLLGLVAPHYQERVLPDAD